MPNVYNIFSIKINDVSRNGSVNFGNNIFKGNTANSKSVGGNFVVGDASPSFNVDRNAVSDPDIAHQTGRTI